MSVSSLWAQQLDAGLADMGLAMQVSQRDLLRRFLQLLVDWNRVFNLTAVRDPQRLVARHLLDSLSLLPFIQGRNVLDIGTGAGLPGIPLAITRPQWSFCLLDSNSKKTRFLTQVRLELGLDNIEVIHSRVENWHPTREFQTITTRAFAPLSRMIRLTRHLAGTTTVWAAMKGPADVEESLALPDGVEMTAHPVHVPGERAPRRILVLRLAEQD